MSPDEITNGPTGQGGGASSVGVADASVGGGAPSVGATRASVGEGAQSQIRPRLLYVCTGNAARSVMAAVITRHLSDLFEVEGAGTHVIEGCPMGTRTRECLASLGLSDPTHKSTQLTSQNAEWADLIIVMEPGHVSYVRRVLPEHAHKTITLKRFVKEFQTAEGVGRSDGVGSGSALGNSPALGSSPTDGSSPPPADINGLSPRNDLTGRLRQQLQKMELDNVTLKAWEEVADPASGDLSDFMVTLDEIHQLVVGLVAGFDSWRNPEGS